MNNTGEKHEPIITPIEVMSPGETLSNQGAFAEGVSTSFGFENGGIRVTIGEGSALQTVGEGAFTVNLTFQVIS